jgi:type IV pilus assembly protein PilY1
VFPHLKNLFDPNASHRFFVDGSPVAADANLGTSTSPKWSTVLVGSTGAGGNGYFALDVENPAQPKPLWEAGSDVSGFENLGATLGRASIVRMQSGEWVAIFGNGYNATDNKAHLYIVDLKTGALLRDILLANSADETASGNAPPNGLSTPLAADRNRDGSVDTVYVGDMLGNLWKIDLSAASSSDWPSSLSTPLFKAADSENTTQPIYAKPAAMLRANTTNEVLVFFGTGKFFEKRDAEGNGHDDYTDLSVQTFYGIKDTDSSNLPLTRTNLVAQTIHKAPAPVGYYDAAELRYLSDNPVSYDPGGQSGFYIDLTVEGVKQGERVTSSPILLHDRVIFTTLVPSPPEDGNVCNTGSTHGWLMQVTLTGGQPDNSVFDLNGDGVFDNKDESGSEIVGGVRIKNSGIAFVPSGKGNGDDDDDNRRNDKCFPYGGDKGPVGGGILCTSPGQGRESWQQLKGR